MKIKKEKAKQRHGNCEIERGRKQEQRREGALKPHFPVDLLVRLCRENCQNS